jgi:hypothetical protein
MVTQIPRERARGNTIALMVVLWLTGMRSGSDHQSEVAARPDRVGAQAQPGHRSRLAKKHDEEKRWPPSRAWTTLLRNRADGVTSIMRIIRHGAAQRGVARRA